jgi:hypothetical protein
MVHVRLFDVGCWQHVETRNVNTILKNYLGLIYVDIVANLVKIARHCQRKIFRKSFVQIYVSLTFASKAKQAGNS